MEAQIITRDRELQRVYKEPVARHAKIFRLPLLLSETLFVRQEIELERYLAVVPQSEISRNTVAIHFRGTDFKLWKAHSIISHDYFVNSIAKLNGYNCINLFSDDHNHPTVREIQRFATENKWNLLTFSGCQYSDFSLLCRADAIVASPSTFSLCAAILGGKQIVFPNSYAIREANNGSNFWVDLVSGKKPNYIKATLA
jgi:hypothetical protein